MRTKGKAVYVGGRHVGYVTTLLSGEEAYVSPRKWHRHYFRKFKGFGVTRKVLRYLRRENIGEVQLRFGESKFLISRTADWFRHGIPYHHREHEAQLILPKRFMREQHLTLMEILE